MSKQTRLVTKGEALTKLSAHIRNPQIEPEMLIKAVNLYGKIAGWDEEPESPSPKDSEENLNKLIAEVERKRKGETNAPNQKS